ncbi:MAG: 2OG-Fe(II) oxygenase [Sphingomonas bacterium]
MRASPVFAVGAFRTALLASPETVAAAFSQHRAIACTHAIEPDLLASLMRLCREGHFEPNEVGGLGDREVESPQRAGRTLTHVLKRTDLMGWIELATGCGQLEAVEGRVVRARANNHDQLLWHDDLDDPQRRLAITINLSEHRYEGGLFELREKRTEKLLAAHHHLEPGTALIFDVGYDIEHRVLPVTSGGPRCVYTGWFYKGAK